MKYIWTQSKRHLKDPGSALTHFVAMLFTIMGIAPLLLKSLNGNNPKGVYSLAIFMISMVLLYAASTIYHSLNISQKINLRLRKLDHAMIFVLIAGSYTPVCALVLKGSLGRNLLIFIWSVAIIGILFKMCWITCPHWLSSTMYILMGWAVVFAFKPLMATLSKPAFLWLLMGGIIYTIGGVIYALKLPIFNQRHKYFGSHEIFHLFVMGGSLCHFIFMYQYIA
ncbi:MAG: hemolysin III family protein [Lachnospiraceae bacterium]|nr:hemolysin III family protein [Lachnospiraceae bacterium]